MKKIIVADSCSLILLWKCSVLEIFADSSSIIIPAAVLDELVNKEFLTLYPESSIVAGLIASKKIRVISLNQKVLKLPISIDKGELDAIALAGQTKNSVLATDDGKAIKACRYIKVPFIISPKIVIELFRLGKIDFTRAKLTIEKLKIIGRYSPDIIAEALLELEVIKDVKNRNSQGS